MIRALIALVFVGLLSTSCSQMELVKGVALNVYDFTAGEDKNDAYYKVGNPYRIGEKWYYPEIDHDYTEVGIASWYGQKFHKKLTANGDVFDKNKISAAHRTLPIPSIVVVDNLENGKSLRLKVNDRGPFAHDRIIDLSEAAAKKLGVYKKGTAQVRVTYDAEASAILYENEKELFRHGKQAIIATAKDVAPKSGANIDVIYYVQVGAYGSYKAARAVKSELSGVGSDDVEIQEIDWRDSKLFRVRIGAFGQVEKADYILNEIGKLGFYDAIIIKE